MKGIQVHRNSFIILLQLAEGKVLNLFIGVHYCIFSLLLAAVLELYALELITAAKSSFSMLAVVNCAVFKALAFSCNCEPL